MLLNNELNLLLPKGFHIMVPSELNRLNFLGDAPDWCISDPDRHIIVSVSWKKSGLASLMLNIGEIVEKMESQMRRAMGPFDYALEDFFEENLGDEKTCGFTYTYEAQGIGMIGKSFAVKRGKCFYYIHCYMREALREESMEFLNWLFNSAYWS